MIALDHYVITDEERIEGAEFQGMYKACSENMSISIPDYANETSAERHIFTLEVDIYKLKRLFEKSSPSIKIQSLFRGYRQK